MNETIAPSDDLKALARKALADADPEGPGGIKLQAIKLVRDADGKQHSLREYIAAIDWAQAHPHAADLPDGSIVATWNLVFIKARPAEWGQWRSTNGRRVYDAHVDEKPAAGAQVLRVGTGKD